MVRQQHSNILKTTLITGWDPFLCTRMTVHVFGTEHKSSVTIPALSFTGGPVWVWRVHFIVCWSSRSSAQTSVQHTVKMLSSEKYVPLRIRFMKLWDLILTVLYVRTVQNNEQRLQKSKFPVFAITLHLMTKHQGILCNKKQLRFIAAALCLIIPEENSAFYLLYHKM